MTGERTSGRQKRSFAPAMTPEARENQLISTAVNEAERLMLEHKAPPSIIVHYLKLATTKTQLEKEKLENENALLRAKTQALESARHVEELYANAIMAMQSYRSIDSSPEAFDD